MNYRVVPEEVKDINLQPVAHPVDKEVKYQPDFGGAFGANNLKPIADGLAKLGQGLVDIDPVIERKAQENIIASQAKLEEKNKQDWAKVSRKITLLGKFNPYNKRAYNQITASQMEREALREMLSDPELYKKSPEQFQEIAQDSFNNLSKAYKQSKIGQRDYIEALEQYNQTIDNLSLKHAQDHAQWQFGQTKNKIQTEGAYNVQKLVYESDDKVVAIQTAMDGSQALMNSLGWADDTQAEILLNTIRDAVAADPSAVNSAEVLMAVKDYQINGKNIKEILPDYEFKLKQMMREVKMADFNDQKLEWDMKKFQQKQGIDEAMNNLTERYIKGELNNPEAFKQAVLEQAQAHGLDGESSIELFKDVINGKTTITALKSTISDPETELQLAMGIIDGSTTREDITAAMAEHKLSADDGYRMIQNMMSSDQKQEAETEKYIKRHLTDTTNEYLKDNKQTGTKAKLRSREDKAWLLNQMNDLAEQYRAGKITQEQFNLELSKRKQFILQDAEKRRKGEAVSAMAKGYEDLRATPQISDAQWNKVDIDRSKQALRRMKITRNAVGGTDSTISLPNGAYPMKYRPSTNGRHTGYDIHSRFAAMGMPVYSPMNGEVVAVLKGDNGGMGNMVLIKCSNGKLIKYMHLQDTALPRLGTLVTKDTVIGHVGNTGAVENEKVGSLHVEFYDANHQWITAWQFMS
jgi:murein DD-endopeptidase MepM/ murein hydrolase activator NlpD